MCCTFRRINVLVVVAVVDIAIVGVAAAAAIYYTQYAPKTERVSSQC